MKKQEYIREYNKQAYKTVKAYIPIEEYEDIKTHMEDMGYKAMSGYIKALIDADMSKAGEKSIHVQNNNGVVMGNNHGTINVGTAGKK